MNVTWVLGFPDGDEQGTFLALDMGGTNLRVCEITLTDKKGAFDITQSKYKMPEELRTGTAEELWEYIADCLQQFIEHHHENEDLAKLPLGFTFSYPATQEYIDHGILQRWTKGFDIDGVEGKDVVPPLEEILKKRVCDETIRPIFTLTSRRAFPLKWLPSSMTPLVHSLPLPTPTPT
jgi:hexokinase